MSYQVLARKWRPRVFADVAGQAHVLQALMNALDSQRLHHAYLFTGTRGVGKTTLARIFAKSLNCEQGVSAKPCGVCSACREIDEGRFLDLIEVDAASRTKVEDTRDLLDNVQYAPTRGRYKVYLIDEVHMLSKHSFNALLKTLEEPPPNIIFLLATTDPQKLPVTVLSRCLQFNLRHLPVPMIQAYLQEILVKESISGEAGGLLAIARAAEGSMRDALSLLDQAIAFGGGTVQTEQVQSMLGTIDDASLRDILTALVNNDAEALLKGVAVFSERTHTFSSDFSNLLDTLIGLLHRIALAQVVPASVVASESQHELIQDMAQRMSKEAVQLYYQIALIGRRDLHLTPDPRMGLEMTLLRMLAFRPLTVDQTVLKTAMAAPEIAPQSLPKPLPVAAPPDPVSSPDWPDILATLKLSGMSQMLASHCVIECLDDQRIVLQLDKAHVHMLNASLEKRIEKSLQDYFKRPLKLEFQTGQPSRETPALRQQREKADRLRKAKESLQADPVVQDLQETFNAHMVNDSIVPLDGLTNGVIN